MLVSVESDLAPIVAHLAAIQERAKELAAEEAALKAEIRQIVSGEPGLYAAGGVDVSVQVNRRFSEKRALASMPEELVPLVTYPETRIDRDRLEVLAPQIYEDSWEVGEPRVGLR